METGAGSDVGWFRKMVFGEVELAEVPPAADLVREMFEEVVLCAEDLDLVKVFEDGGGDFFDEVIVESEDLEA